MLVDSARAVAEALVVRQGSEPDPHWNDKAAQVICALLVLVLMRFEGEDRSLNSVQEIASDPEMLAAAADKLREMGGIPARLGNQLKCLFDKEQAGTLSKEGAGVLSTVARHLAFLDSELVARSVARSTFDPAVPAEARHDAVPANPAGPAGGAERSAALLDFHAGADDRRGRE